MEDFDTRTTKASKNFKSDHFCVMLKKNKVDIFEMYLLNCLYNIYDTLIRSHYKYKKYQAAVTMKALYKGSWTFYIINREASILNMGF